MSKLFEKYEHILRQNEVYNDRLQKQLKSSNICAIVQGTGTGKTYQIMQIIHDMCVEKWTGSNHINILIIVPTNFLVGDWQRHLDIDFEEDLENADENERKKFEAKISQEFDFKGFKISFTYEVITYDGLRTAVGLKKEDAEAKLTSGVTSSLDNLISGINLIVFDEAHHLGATTTAPLAAYIISKAGGNRYVVGMTATDEKVNGKNLKSFFNKNVINGFTREQGQDGSYEAYTDVTRIEISDKGNEKVLPKINWIRSIVYDPKLSTSRSIYTFYVRWIKSGTDLKLRKMNLEKLDRIFDDLTVEDYAKYAKNLLQKNVSQQKLVCFYQEGENVSAVRNFVEKAFGITKIVDVHSDKSSIENDKALETFRGVDADNNALPGSDEDIIILAVNKLSEGLHIGGVTGIIMIRSTLSPIIFNQQIGRAMSYNARNNTIPVFDIIGNSLKHTDTSDIEMEAFLHSMEDQMDDTKSLQNAVRELEDFTRVLRALTERGELKEENLGSISDLKATLWNILYMNLSKINEITDYSIASLRKIADEDLIEKGSRDKHYPYDPTLFTDKHYQQALFYSGTKADRGEGQPDLPLFYYIINSRVKRFGKFYDFAEIATWLKEHFNLKEKDVIEKIKKLKDKHFFYSLVEVKEEHNLIGLYLNGFDLKDLTELI